MLLRERNAFPLAFVLACAIPLIGPTSPSRAEDKPAPAPEIREMTISPQQAPVPSLRYRLLPTESERTPGDAVPIYLRVCVLSNEEAVKQIRTNSAKWLNGPLDRLPVAEARKFVDTWEGGLKQLDFGARRRTAEWNYTLPEQKEEAIAILLPDVQELRTWTHLLELRARVEIAEKKFDPAIRTIETGLGMARHLAEGPFLINGLVGIAAATQSLSCLRELIAQSDAPNMYWALTALPRPLIDLRKEMETEQAMMEYMMPEIGDLDTPRTDAEWDSRLARLHGRWNRLAELINAPVETAQAHSAPAAPARPVLKVDADLAKFRADVLPEARAFHEARHQSIEGMSDARVIVAYIAGQYRENRDLSSRPYYLPYPEAVPLYAAAEAQREALKSKGAIPAIFVASVPAVSAGHAAQVRLDRLVATLRVIEALRLQAHADHGVLPESLARVTVVPIPDDPATGRPFDFRREGDTAILTVPGLAAGHKPVVYRITARK